MLTWSLGCTGFLEPITPPSISIARFEITSLAFMLDCVPEPVCHTTSGKCSSSLPSITSCAAATMALPSVRVEPAERHVGFGGGALDDAERAHDRFGLLLPADLEVAERALRLRAPILVGGHLDGAERIGLGADLAGRRGLVGGHRCSSLGPRECDEDRPLARSPQRSPSANGRLSSSISRRATNLAKLELCRHELLERCEPARSRRRDATTVTLEFLPGVNAPAGW